MQRGYAGWHAGCEGVISLSLGRGVGKTGGGSPASREALIIACMVEYQRRRA